MKARNGPAEGLIQNGCTLVTPAPVRGLFGRFRATVFRGKGGRTVFALRNLVSDEGGQGLAEYALLGAIVAVALIASLVALRSPIQTLYSRIRTGLTST